jgi:multiple sugar transport system permease protein/raffinose/stachyose/melibiose transport system permease protein
MDTQVQLPAGVSGRGAGNPLLPVKLRKKLSSLGVALMFLAPALAFYTLFSVYPLLRNAFLSFHEQELVGKELTWVYVGTENFVNLLTNDLVFPKSVAHNFIWAASAIILETSIALILASIIHRRVTGAATFRVLWFMPVILSDVIGATIWSWVYQYDYGVLNGLLRFIGLESLARPWLGDPSTALAALINITTWKWTGFNMILLLAAMSTIPSDVLDAARIDGVTEWQNIRHIILPLIRPMLVTAMLLNFVGKMKIFDLVWVATRGGPALATETVPTYFLRVAFPTSFTAESRMGYAAAIATVWFLIILIISILLSRLLRGRGDDVVEY